MNNSQNTTIILLTITAAILTSMLITAAVMDTRPAYGATAARQGNYIAATGSYSKNMELLYVIDLNTRSMQTYAPNTNRGTLEVVGKRIELDRLFSGR